MKVFGCLVSLFLGFSAHADHPAVHGMLVFGGEKGLYASHLPMFHPPHDRQVILKIAFEAKPGSPALDAFAAARAAGKKLFTIEPEVMDLAQIVSGTKKEFGAALYDGHFERGGQNLGGVQVVIEKVVFASKLTGFSSAPGVVQDQYLVFGEQGEYFAAHLIQAKPSFDAILEVKQPYNVMRGYCGRRICDDDQPPRSIHFPIPDGQLPLQMVGPAHAWEWNSPSGILLGAPLMEHTQVKNVIYLEEGDLSH